MHGIRRARRAMSVVEMLVASSLILAILVAAASTLTASEKNLARTIARDNATLTAANLLEQASLFNCQTLSDPTEARAQAAVCAALFDRAGDITAEALPAGDSVSRMRVPAGCTAGTPGCTTFTVTLTSFWVRPGQDPAACTGDGATQPALLVRRAEFRWRAAGATEEVRRSYVSASRRPDGDGFGDTSRAGLLVSAAPGSAVVLRSSSGDAMVRVARACTGTPTGGEAWFPYLPGDGAYTLTTVPAPENGDFDVETFATLTAANTSGSPVAVGDCARIDGSCLLRIDGGGQ